MPDARHNHTIVSHPLPECHEVKHMGRAGAMGRARQAIQHLMKVNGWSEDDALAYVEVAFEVWSRRSQEEWTLDLSWLG